jgi:hypothetical protein
MSLDVISTIFPSTMIIICIIGAIYLITHKDKGTTECSVFIHNNDDWF